MYVVNAILMLHCQNSVIIIYKSDDLKVHLSAVECDFSFLQLRFNLTLPCFNFSTFIL